MKYKNTISPSFGLLETPLDERDFQLGAITQLPTLEELPNQFLINVKIKDQRGSDFCSAYMSCAMSEAQERLELEPSWSFAMSKVISGNVEAWGQNLRDALKAHVKFGALPWDVLDYNVHTQTPEFLRDIKNWPDVSDEAYEYRKKSYFKVTGPYDHFDNARASLWKFKNAPIGTGVIWSWDLETETLDTFKDQGYGHAVTIVGFDGDYLILQNSYGSKAGIGGHHRITREVYNHYVDRFGAYMFVDIDPEDAQNKISAGVKLEDNWLIELWKKFINLFK